MEKRVTPLKLLLLKDNIKEYEQVLKKPSELIKYNLDPNSEFTGAFFVRKPRKKVPDWVKFIKSGIESEIMLLENSSTAAVLFIEQDSRIFLITFGYGRSLINGDSYVVDFGLKVALNSLRPDHILCLEAKKYEEPTIDTKRQTSRGSAIGTFELDYEIDILRSITGEISDEKLGKLLSGRDSLFIKPSIVFSDIGTICKEVLAKYNSDDYKVNYPWYDNLKEIRDNTLIGSLNEFLIENLKQKNFDKLYIAPPEVITWENIDGFRYSIERGSDKVHPSLDLGDYLAAVSDVDVITLDKLRDDKVQIQYTEQQYLIDMWSLYNCFVFEISEGSKLFVLTMGKWFQIESSFVEKVKNSISKLRTSTLSLPNAGQGESELDYNRRASTGLRNSALMDRELIRYAGRLVNIEMCDIFTSQRQFIHIKKKKSSSTLSHLFAQGDNSAMAFLQDTEFRKKAREVLGRVNPNLVDLIPIENPSPRDFEIVFGIISSGTDIPFFSQLFLMQIAARLRVIGFSVSLQMINGPS